MLCQKIYCHDKNGIDTSIEGRAPHTGMTNKLIMIETLIEDGNLLTLRIWAELTSSSEDCMSSQITASVQDSSCDYWLVS